MPRRPQLSESSLLAAIFAPKNNPVPTGLRKRPLVGAKGRKAARLKAYNNMSALNQKALKDSGQREAYLKGESTLAEAKRILRNRAVNLGIVKPLRVKAPDRPSGVMMTPTKTNRVVSHLWQQLNGSVLRRKPNINTIRRGTLMMSKDQLDEALSMSAADIKNAARNVDLKVETPSGETFNPFWYN